MKYLLIILAFLSYSTHNASIQDLEQVIPPKPKGVLAEDVGLNDEERSEDTENLSSLLETESGTTEEAITRDPTTYRKEEYLNKLLRQTYYQRLMTPAWSKYLNPSGWEKNVLKWRYWRQLKNYIARNDQEVLVLRNKMVPVADTVITLEESTPHVDSMPILASVLSEQSDFETETIQEVKIDVPNDEIVDPELESKKAETFTKEEEVRSKNIPPPARSQDLIQQITTPTKDEPNPERLQDKVVNADAESDKKTDKTTKLAVESGIHNLSFHERFGRLSWPVSRGKVTDKFGLRKNAEARGLRRENYGIDMVCPAGEVIKAVHDGTVLMAKRQSPYDFIVTVKHDYFTTAHYYLIKTYVKPGDKVKEGQALGQLRTSVAEADFHFEIWNNQDRVNPELWLQKR